MYFNINIQYRHLFSYILSGEKYFFFIKYKWHLYWNILNIDFKVDKVKVAVISHCSSFMNIISSLHFIIHQRSAHSNLLLFSIEKLRNNSIGFGSLFSSTVLCASMPLHIWLKNVQSFYCKGLPSLCISFGDMPLLKFWLPI